MITKTAKPTYSLSSAPRIFAASVLILLIFLGCALRFSRLGFADYWENEANGAQVLSGIDANQMRDELANKTVTFGSLFERYQSRNPTATLDSMMKVLITSHSGHAPGYYTLLFFWTGWFDSHRATTRQLSALLSLLQLPALFFLVLELFGSPLLAFLSVCIFALSPFQLLYAQEVSEYSLFAACACLVNLCLLRALRKHGIFDWLIYMVATTASLIVSVNTAYLLLAHGLIVLVEERPQLKSGSVIFSRSLLLWIAAITLAAAIISPYIYIVVQHMIAMGSTGLEFLSTKTTATNLLSGWADVLISPFYALGSVKTLIPLKLLLAILSMAAIFFTALVGQGRSRTLLLSTAIVPFLCLFIPDVGLGGFRSTLPKYIMSVPISLTIMIAFMFFKPLESKRTKALWRLFTGGALTALLLLEIGCCIKILSERQHAYMSEGFDTIADIISADKKCLVLSQEQPSLMNIHQLLCLSHIVDPAARLMWLDNPDELVLPEKTSHFYVYNAPDSLVYLLGTYGYKFQPQKKVWYFDRVDTP